MQPAHLKQRLVLSFQEGVNKQMLISKLSRMFQVTQDMLPLHDRLMQHEDAGPLLEPVDPIALQIPVCVA